MSYQFLVLTGPKARRTITIQPGPDRLMGRSEKAFYQFPDDPRISRFHCEVLLEGEQPTVICRGGSSGTLVNGKPVTRHTLKLGDVLRIGDTELRLVMGDFALKDALGAIDPNASLPITAELALTEVEAISGKTLAHYEIGHVIGQGRCGLVFHANDTKDNRSVGLKVLHPSYSKDEEMMQRFVRGMKTAMPLRHPNLISIYSAGKTGGYCWIAMEYIAGESLKEVIARIGVANRLDWKNAFGMTLEIARALEYAHGHGLVHRNVTPTNIMQQATDQVCKLSDLMLAKALEGAENITRPGEVLGELEYLSPERTRGVTELDARSDLYGLGATAYALLTGRPPFEGGTVIEKFTKIRQHEPVRPTKYQKTILPEFEGMILKLLAKKPEDRYQSASHLIRDLNRILGKAALVKE